MVNGWWVATVYERSPPELLARVIWVIGSIVLHELAHGWAAIRKGDRTPIETGHMTWNPLVHMGQQSLIMFALVGIAWGAMPVDWTRLRGRHADAYVSFAGPAMNLLLAIASLLALCFWLAIAGGLWFRGVRVPDPLFSNFAMFFRVGLIFNLVLMALNLMPVPPLDGSRIARSYFPSYDRFWHGEQAQYIALFAFVALFFFGGPYIFGAARDVGDAAAHALLSVMLPGARP
jgi:Zn-dependent protease